MEDFIKVQMARNGAKEIFHGAREFFHGAEGLSDTWKTSSRFKWQEMGRKRFFMEQGSFFMEQKAPQPVDSKFNDFLPWLRQKFGAEITSHLLIKKSKIDTQDNLPTKVSSLLGKDVSNRANLALVILLQQKLGRASKWVPNISSLPPTYFGVITNKFYQVQVVVASQLKDLTVRNWQGLHLISAPELVSLCFEGLQSQWFRFSSYGLCLWRMWIYVLFKECYYKPNKPDAHTIFDLLQQIHSVKYLTLNLENFQLPYGTIADDAMRGLNLQASQTDGLIFVSVTGQTMELG
ncbi:Rubisco LS methyltransferase, substrate-binding domain-containing protein [Artemisia annua]|uniref:Rubisco LS methyltransferase, substrate-binding domain-containing protein n=1 Tax=Artemisia annua TaxID=35608 RepID=A0A2U1KMY0_ARTAN|nr:Rubisco LS methyltransferase, substrate-binding domain-containing protein [Artemisia annua]